MTQEQVIAPVAAANENAPVDQDALSLEQLANGVLNRDFRPRIGSIRRLAEAALAPTPTPAKPSKKKNAKSGKSGKSAAASAKKKSSSKKRKQAKIPGQKGK